MSKKSQIKFGPFRSIFLGRTDDDKITIDLVEDASFFGKIASVKITQTQARKIIRVLNQLIDTKNPCKVRNHKH